MALKKKIIATNGIPLEYHKIALISIDVNNQITILVHSYLNEESRQYEKDYDAGLIEGEPQFPYYDYEYISVDYVENIGSLNGDTPTCAYNLLRKLKPELSDAEDC